MKIKRLFASALIIGVIASQFLMSASAAAPKTKAFLDPMDNPAFPMANQVNIKIPANYDANPSKSEVFGITADQKALAAIKTRSTVELFERVYGSYSRSKVLFKNYVAVDIEIIYEFKNGFKDFEFMGVCGAGWWAGMYGMKNTFEVAYADKLTGPWTTYDYMSIRDISGDEATRAYFRSSNVPTTARYLRLKYLEGSDSNYDATTDKPRFANWQAVPGYLYVNEYETAPSAGGTASSKNSSAKQPVSSVASTASKNTSSVAGSVASTTESSQGSVESDSSEMSDSSLSGEDVSAQSAVPALIILQK